MAEEVNKKFLSNLFQPDLVRNGESLKRLKEIGGYRGLAEAIETNLKTGLKTDPADKARRIRKFEDNAPIEKKIKTLWEHITEALEDKILRILCFAAVVSTAIGVFEHGWKEGWMEGAGILIAVVAIVCVTAGNNYAKDKQFQKLYQQVDTRNINVIRDGKVQSKVIFDLLVGDLVQIETGEILPVDGVVIEANNLKADESQITGESDAITKKVPKTFTEAKINCFLISGSKINEGTGVMLVLTVGKNTVYGKIQKTLQQDEDETPLQEKLAVLADLIGKVGVYCSIGTFTAMTIHLFIELIITGQGFFTMYVLQCFMDHFIVGITVIVVAVPEGLPLAVTIALAYSVGKMRKENNLVRVLTACETMGGADNICSDKTGTLTLNQMTVINMFCQEKNIVGKQDPKNRNLTIFDKNDFKPNVLELLCQNACVNANCFPKISEKTQFEQIGNKTECALVELAYRLDKAYDYTKYRPSEKIRQVIPFSSATKKMTTIWELDRTVARLFTKGAPEILLPLCTHYLDQDGIKRRVHETFINQLKSQVDAYADKSQRTLLLAYKDMPNRHVDNYGTDQQLNKELCIIAIVGIKDPLRPGIKEAVVKCDKAGVKVRMVTGDIRKTAVAISKDAGILPANYVDSEDKFDVMEGKKFREYVANEKGESIVKVTNKDGSTVDVVGNQQKFNEVAGKLKVLARSSPEDKYLLVTGLKLAKHTVAVTGDGTNDAPALKKADVGFAMGIAGTEVAKNAAKIILLDDNFASIVIAIKWGRNIFDCIQKFLQFQLTINVVAIVMTFIGGITIRETPLITIQMLWINLIMDTLASLALATEPPSDKLLDRDPYNRDSSIITINMWRNIMGQSIFQLVVCNVILFYGDTLFGVPSGIHVDKWTYELGAHKTIYFSIFVFMQVFNEINARKLDRNEYNVFEGFFNNPMFLGVIIGTIIMHFFLVEYGGKVMQTTPLSYEVHGITLLIGLGSLVNGFIIKFLPDCFFSWLPSDSQVKGEDEVERMQKPLLSKVNTMRKSKSMLKRQSMHENANKKLK